MTAPAPCWIGIDPGGAKAFGVAVLQGANVLTRTVGSVDEALAALAAQLQDAPAGVGIDAPMWWSSGQSGDRQADRSLRTEYGLSGGQVQTVNSLRGAALVQAMMFAVRIRSRYHGVPITETHPKAVLAAVSGGDWASFAAQFSIDPSPGKDLHQRDAIIGAVAAREGFEGRWTRDLSTERLESEQDPRSYWLAPVHYFWPDR